MNNERIAAFGGSGMEMTNRSAGWCTSQVAPSTPGGCSTTTLREATMMKSGYRFDGHAFRPGEYVSIAHDDDLHTFKVVSVEPAL